MYDAETEGKEQQLHRLIYRFKPKRRRADVLSEKVTGNHLRQIAVPASEKRAPKDGGDTAISEHTHRFPHFRSQIELFESNGGDNDHNKPVSGVGKHHSEEKVIEKRHYGGRVEIVLSRQRIHFGYALDRSRKPVVFKQNGDIVLLVGLVNPHRSRKALFKLLGNTAAVFFGNVAGYYHRFLAFGGFLQSTKPILLHRKPVIIKLGVLKSF